MKEENVPLDVPLLMLRFVYDSNGRRVSKAVHEKRTPSEPGSTRPTTWNPIEMTVFYYDAWNLMAEVNLIHSEQSRRYIWGTDLSGTMKGAGGVGGLLGIGGLTGKVKHLPCTEVNGNIMGLIGATSGELLTRWDYDAFGNMVTDWVRPGSVPAQCPLKFSTKYLDEETDLRYYGYRYYRPVDGRWISKDPLGHKGGSNLYAAIKNGTTYSIDPVGLITSMNDWGGNSVETYSGTVCFSQEERLKQEETIRLLTRAIANRTELAPDLKVDADGHVNIAPLLSWLEQMIRRRIVKATGRFQGRWGGESSVPIEAVERGEVSLPQVFDTPMKNAPAVECAGAARLVMEEGVRQVIGDSRFNAIRKNGGLVLRARDVPDHHDTKPGDWGYIWNDERYSEKYPNGPMQGQNVITVGYDLYWGHPNHRLNYKGWLQFLINNYNSGLPDNEHIDSVPGWDSAAVQFWDVVEIAKKMFENASKSYGWK